MFPNITLIKAEKLLKYFKDTLTVNYFLYDSFHSSLLKLMFAHCVGSQKDFFFKGHFKAYS